MSVIDLEMLGLIIEKIEDLMDSEGCNFMDKRYILQEMLNRQTMELQRQRTQDMMGKIDPGEMIKKLMGKKE